MFTSVRESGPQAHEVCIRAYSTQARPFQWKYTDIQRRSRTNALTATGHLAIGDYTATLEQAETVRRKHSETLRRLGAWGVSVEERVARGKKSFVVVALFENEPPSDIPKSLTATRRGELVSAPVVTRLQERFRLR